MRRLIAAVVLALFMAVGTNAHDVSAPIQPVPDYLFVQIEPKESDTATIVDTFPTVSPTKPTIPEVPRPNVVHKIAATVSTSGFRLDREVSWYGPGFYGHRTACGLAYTRQILGVANRTLPCGTKVEFMWEGKSVIVPVIDRGPYVTGRQWDLSGGLCVYLHHCFTGSIYYRILGK